MCSLCLDWLVMLRPVTTVLLVLQIVSASGESAVGACIREEIAGYSSKNGCRLKQMKENPLRVVYLDKQYVTQNNAAIQRIKSKNQEYFFAKTCETPATAVPEWQVLCK